MNDTVIERGLVRSCIVFVLLQSFSILHGDIQDQNYRMSATKINQEDMNSLVAKRHVLTVIITYIPPPAELPYILEEEVLVYNKSKMKWLGMYVYSCREYRKDDNCIQST